MRSVLVIFIAVNYTLVFEIGRGEGKNWPPTSKAGFSNPVYSYYSWESKNGSIKSPDYPYLSKTEFYRRYEFHGEDNELVQIVFGSFNLYKRDTNVRCGKEDSRLAYTGDKGEPDVVLCGNSVGENRLPLPILSDDNDFVVQFWQMENPNNSGNEQGGFNATYAFVTNWGIESGVQMGDDECTFNYNSSVQKNGTFNSPNYPGFYTKRTKCVYLFTGVEPYIRFTFLNFSLLGSNDCSSNEEVEIRGSADNDPSYFSQKLCGTRHSPDVVDVKNENGTIFVSFQSSDGLDGEAAATQPSFVGFVATYNFTNDTISRATDVKRVKSESILVLPVLVFTLAASVF